MADLELVPGHIHMGLTPDGNIARVWPTPDPDRWHVTFSRCSRATTEPVSTADVPGLLEGWGVTAESWTRWAGPIHERNPGLDG